MTFVPYGVIGRDKLSALVRTGLLRARTKLRRSPRIRHDCDVVAKVIQGVISAGSRTYSTPSGAARAVIARPVDARLFWRLPSGEFLASLRGQPP